MLLCSSKWLLLTKWCSFAIIIKIIYMSQCFFQYSYLLLLGAASTGSLVSKHNSYDSFRKVLFGTDGWAHRRGGNCVPYRNKGMHPPQWRHHQRSGDSPWRQKCFRVWQIGLWSNHLADIHPLSSTLPAGDGARWDEWIPLVHRRVTLHYGTAVRMVAPKEDRFRMWMT